MPLSIFIRKRGWAWTAALLVLAAAALMLGPRLAGRQRAPRPAAEVVYAKPIKVEHMMAQPAAAPPGTNPGGAPAAASSGRPRAELSGDFYDFGSVGAQAVVQHDFFIINSGSAALVIRQAFTTCGCTTAELTASIIPPGKASRITVTFDAGFHPVSGSTVRRGLVLETNDPDHPEITLWVQAAVE